MPLISQSFDRYRRSPELESGGGILLVGPGIGVRVCSTSIIDVGSET
jgi:hypothetical protein